MMRIVKPYDWQIVRTPELVVVIEDLVEPGHIVELYTRHDYFHVVAGRRKALARATCELLPGRIARAVLPVEHVGGPCVLDLMDPAGTVLLACGVTIGAGPVTTWTPRAAPEADAPGAGTEGGFRYPVLLTSFALSHTPGDVQCDAPPAPSVSALCDMAPVRGRAVVGAVALSQAAAFDGRKTLSVPHSLGVDQPEFTDALNAAQWTSIVPYVVRLRDACAHVPSGFVMTKDGMWSDSTLTVFFNDPELRQQPSLFRAHDQVGFLGGATDAREILAANGTHRFPGNPMPICNVGYRNHAHWVLNSLLPAYQCREAIAAGQICVILPEYTDYMFATLLSIGVPRSAILVAPKGFYRFKDVLFPSTLSTHVNRAIPPEATGMFDMVRRHCLARTGTRGPRLVYLTRQGSQAQRKISNEDALIAALAERGFVCVAPHELTFEEEVSCMSDADVVVGQLGAAMINIAFAPRTAWVVEIASHNYMSADYLVMAATLGQRFARLMCRAPSQDKLTLTDFSFEVPLADTLSAVDRICAAAAAAREARGQAGAQG